MAAQHRPLELELLCQKLDEDFVNQIAGTGASPAARQSNFYSKAIAAFLLCKAAGATLEEAVAASIDGGLDHGIDSVFVAADNTLWLVQSKYQASGSGEPELGDISKFRDGVEDLLHGKLERFNDALQARAEVITNALNNEACRVKVILVYTGTAVSDDRRHIFGTLERAFNGTNPGFLQCSTYGLTALHESHLEGNAPALIEADIELHNFGYSQAPYRAFYGRMSAKPLAQLYQRHGDYLVERNIRRYKGSTTVNEGLSGTLQQEAEHFFYLNNGVTFLCNSIREVHPRDPNCQLGRLRVTGLSIINGAQTVGAIAREEPAYYETHPAEVMATFICLENAPDDFGDKVTLSRNRQNAVDLEDFAALDERQGVWRQTLALESIDYLIKHGDDDPSHSPQVFSVREAAPALACALPGSDWPDFVVAAKCDRKKLFGRPGLVAARGPLAKAYDRLFTDSLTAREIWRAVQISRFVQTKLRDRAGEPGPGNLPPEALTTAEILKNCGWLLLHVLFIRTGLLNGPTLALSEADTQSLSIELDQAALKLTEVVQAQAWGKQARSLFENKTDSQTIKRLLMAALAQRA
ncbi:AIPR family protein [Stutzerimonas xanthomarina]|uniref:AIPR family protein n=1 Tax=Stutzerimonas xanthomarina TaxID=271420 RepID=UPI0029B1C7A1|nr:AIPR family protein [Stutzerimonas xanthomarina]MDX2352595.1 AIPR family protein [Stutzerimonas xanthomarina]